MKILHLSILFILTWVTSGNSMEPVFVVRNASGDSKEGNILRAVDSKILEMMDPDGKSFSIAGPVFMSRKNKEIPRLPRGNTLWLMNDDCVGFDKLEMKDDSFEFESTDFIPGLKLSIPLVDCKLIWFKNMLGLVDARSYRSQLLAGVRSKDMIVLSNSERVEGVLESLDLKTLTLESGAGKTSYKMDSISVLSLGIDANLKKEKIPEAVALVLASGTRLTLAKFTISKNVLEGTTMQGMKTQIPIEKIRHAVFFGENTIPIQELKDVKVTHFQFFGPPIESKVLPVARNVDFLISGSSYPNGFATNGSNLITVSLDGKYGRFCGVFGFDDISGRQGRANIKFLADGKVVASWEGYSFKSEPVEFSLPMSEVKELSIAIESSLGGKINWCNCILLGQK